MSLLANGLGYAISDTWLVRNVDVKVMPGELMVILGPNGAGKSTLFKLLSGEWPASEGTVSLEGQDYPHWQANELARTRAILPQHSSLTFPFTVEEVVQMGRTPHATGAKRDAAIVAELIERCDLQHLRNRLYPWLSGGEKQRVQLARVLAQIWPTEHDRQSHKYLFLDEPNSGLDIAHQHSMLAIAKELTQRGYAVVVILHDLNLASAYADRVLMLDRGAMVGVGTVAEVFKQPLLQQVFAVDVKIIDHPERNTPWVIW